MLALRHAGSFTTVPFSLVFRKDFALGVVSDDPFVHVTPYVQALCSKLRHGRFEESMVSPERVDVEDFKS
jgi:hypothetical protein